MSDVFTDQTGAFHHQNYRDHRKVTVIDGQTAFTGGVNLADEYINRKERFGHWKDTAIMVKGDAVKSFTMMFLQMWDAASPKSKNEENYEQYLVPADYKLPEGYAGNGFVMPYADSPLDAEQVGEQVYLDILNQAKSYVHIITPYLILDDEMKNAMAYAAKRGHRCEDHHAPYSGQKVCVSVSKNLLSRTDRFRSEDLRIRAWLYPCQDLCQR